MHCKSEVVVKTEQVNHVSNFAGILGKCPPPAPSSLLKKLQEETTASSSVNPQHGKVRVVLRVANSGVLDPDFIPGEGVDRGVRRTHSYTLAFQCFSCLLVSKGHKDKDGENVGQMSLFD